MVLCLRAACHACKNVRSWQVQWAACHARTYGNDKCNEQPVMHERTAMTSAMSSLSCTNGRSWQVQWAAMRARTDSHDMCNESHSTQWLTALFLKHRINHNIKPMAILQLLFIDILYYHYYYYLKIPAMQGWERAIYTLSVQRPQSHNTNLQKERRERENSRIQRGSRQLRPIKKTLVPLLKPASPINEYRIRKIVQQWHWEGNKSPAILRGFAARRRTSIPMSDQSTAGNLQRHSRHR